MKSGIRQKNNDYIDCMNMKPSPALYTKNSISKNRKKKSVEKLHLPDTDPDFESVLAEKRKIRTKPENKKASGKYTKKENGTIKTAAAGSGKPEAGKNLHLQTSEPFQSAVIPYLYLDGELHVMLITASGGGPWILPKGNIVKGMTAWDSAAKEAYEEAGITGNGKSTEFGSYTYAKPGGKQKILVKVYPMEILQILQKWDESDSRKRGLFTFEDALIAVRDPAIRNLLKNFHEKYNKGTYSREKVNVD